MVALFLNLSRIPEVPSVDPSLRMMYSEAPNPVDARRVSIKARAFTSSLRIGTSTLTLFSMVQERSLTTLIVKKLMIEMTREVAASIEIKRRRVCISN
jgi:hypothetical protein